MVGMTVCRRAFLYLGYKQLFLVRLAHFDTNFSIIDDYSAPNWVRVIKIMGIFLYKWAVLSNFAE